MSVDDLFRELDVSDEFLNELTELTKKYGVIIHGCGCCSSPSLYELKRA
jgi:hypothetical protein